MIMVKNINANINFKLDDYGTKNCTCGHGYGGYQCGCKCPRGCVE